MILLVPPLPSVFQEKEVKVNFTNREEINRNLAYKKKKKKKENEDKRSTKSPTLFLGSSEHCKDTGMGSSLAGLKERNPPSQPQY